MAGRTLSLAAKVLGEKLAPRGAQRALTREMSCGEGVVNRWLSGERIPSAVRAAFLEKKFGIPVSWWGEPIPKSVESDAA
jgi:hypothetical protein